MADQDQDKTEQKSQKKLQEAKERGEIPHSQELATLVVFTVLLVYFYFVRTQWLEGFGSIMADFLAFDRHLDLRRETLEEFFLEPALKSALLLAPFFLIVLAVSTAANLGQTGFNFAKNRLRIDWERLDPVRGARRLVSLRAWLEGAKSLVKISLFTLLAYWTIRSAVPAIAELAGRDLRHQVGLMISLALTVGARIAILMAALATLDYGFQWRQFQESLKMTPREMKEEAKEHEGDPLVRQRMRSLRMQMARKRMMSQVPKASVIVTNPTHVAVAIAYEREKMAAPYVCAKGRRYLAARIREIALAHGIPIVENPAVARALYRRVKIGQMIPSEFYRVVAEILAFVYLLKRRPGATPSRPLKPRLRATLPAALMSEGDVL